MITVVRPWIFVAALALLAVPAFATTYIVPSDAEMLQKADDVVIATGLTALSERTSGGSIVTRYTLRVVETLKGDLETGAHLVLTEAGGNVGDAAKVVPGAPDYEPGVRYLIFTTANRDLEPVTFGMSLGQFRYVADGARDLAVRREIHGYDQNFEQHVERARDAGRFAAWIRDTLAQRGSVPDYFVDGAQDRQIAAESELAANAFNRNSYLMQSGGLGFRWQNPSAAWVRAGTQPGGTGPASVAVAVREWNSTLTAIQLTDAGVDETALGGLASEDGKNAVLFNDPNDEIQNGNGIAGIGGVSTTTGQYTFDGETFWNAAEGDVVIANQNFPQSCLNSVMTHEIGHTLGFRHSNIAPTGLSCGSTAQCSSTAIMNSSVSCSMDGVLQPYDKTAASAVYGGTAVVAPLPERLTMLGGRFQVEVRYRNQFETPAKEGKLLARSLFSTQLSETAVFTFGDPQVVELMVRLSDARPFDDNIHVFLGGLSDVEFFIVVTDSLTGKTKEYRKPANQLLGVIDRTTFPAANALQSGVDALMAQTGAGTVEPEESSTIRLLGGRFEVRLRYRNQFATPAAEGTLNARSISSSPTTETAVFYFDANVGSVEWMVRFSDARPFANRIDFFHGGLTDVELTIEVLDTKTGQRREYHKDAFALTGQVDRDSYQP